MVLARIQEADGTVEEALMITDKDMAKEIRRLLPIKDLLNRLGLTPQQGFVNCPFHNDDTASCRIYTRTNTFYCFGCGAGGDIINFAMQWYVLGFKSTLERLNEDCSLGLPIGRKMTLRENRDLSKRAADAAKRRAEADAKKAKALLDYYNALDLWRALCRAVKIYAPKTPDEPLHPMFVHAIMHIDAAEDALAAAEGEVIRIAA